MNRERIEWLVLLRVATDRRATAKSVEKTLRTAVGDALDEGAVARAIGALRDRGELDAARLRITDAGRRRVESALGIELTEGTKWQALMREVVLPRALGGDAAPVRADDLRAALIARDAELRLHGPLGRVLDALVWRELGIDADDALTPAKLRARVIAKRLGGARDVPLERGVKVLAARAARSRRPDPSDLGRAVIAAWLAADAPERAEDVVPPRPPEPPVLSPERFANLVAHAARSSGARRVGDDKAFIASIWDALRAKPELGAMDLAEFQARLVDAHQRGLLVLSRADLTQTMDRGDVQASETRHLGASFHFVRLDTETRGTA